MSPNLGPGRATISFGSATIYLHDRREIMAFYMATFYILLIWRDRDKSFMRFLLTQDTSFM